VTTLCTAVAAHPAIKEFGYGCSRCSIPLPSTLHFALRFSSNKGITDASCFALANLLRTVPTLEKLE
jgi:hypothetical protein